ncbi:MAG: hypothetical protein HOP33_02370 [Verrucomicrobia bacterium]|nr:hypothetical protein [Verrucomicrobiota bacterium]
MNNVTKPKRVLLKISPGFDSRKLEGKTLEQNFDDFVDVYEDRIRGWLLTWAHELNKPEHAGFAALQLALAFFEGFAVFHDGEDSDGRSGAFFGRGFRLVFPQLDELPEKKAESIVKKLYRLGRCGLFHLGMVRAGVFLHDGDFEFEVGFDAADEAAAIYINRHLFVKAITTRFEQYITELRDKSNSERRRRFVIAWKLVHPN